MYTKIDMETWHGASMYAHFNAMDMPFYSITATLDVSGILALSQRCHCSFFSLCLYGIQHGINAVEAFRCRTLPDGSVVCYDYVETVYLILLEQGELTSVRAPFQTDITAFMAEQHTREQEARARAAAFGASYCPADERGVIFYSSIPWFSFTSMSHPLNGGSRYDSIPRLTTGKYTLQADGTAVMPVNVHMHHGFVGGVHVAQLLAAIHAAWQALCAAPQAVQARQG